MSEGLFGGLFADLNMAFFKSKRGLLKVAQMVSISAHNIRFSVFFPPQVCNKIRSRVNNMKCDINFLNASASKTVFDFSGKYQE